MSSELRFGRKDEGECDKFKLKGRGWGFPVHPEFFVEVDFEKAVDQQTRPVTKILRGSGLRLCPRDSRAHIWSIFDSILPNHFNMLKTMKFYQNWIKIG